MRKTWSIMRRDLLKLGRNPLTVFTSVLLPIIYLVIFGNSFQGVLKHLPVVIVSQDNGPYAIRVMEQMQALAAGPKTIAITYNSDAGTALQDVRDGVYKAALIIPPGFSHSIAEGRIGELGLFTDNVDSISAATLTGVFSQATASIRVNYVTAREPKLDQIVMRPNNLFTTVDYDRSLIPGVIVMALFMGSLTSGVFNWVMDRFMGVTECYLVTPLSRWNLAAGMLGLERAGDQRRVGDRACGGIADHRRDDYRRSAGGRDAGRRDHPRGDRDPRDDLRFVGAREQSARGRRVGRLSQRDPVFSERRHLSNRKLSTVVAGLRALQSRDPRGERAQIDPVQGRELRRDLERRHISDRVHRDHAGDREHDGKAHALAPAPTTARAISYPTSSGRDRDCRAARK